MGHILLCFGSDDIPDLKRMLGVCVSFIRYLCGADVSL